MRLNKQSVFGFVLIRLCLVALGVTWLDLQAQQSMIQRKLVPVPAAQARTVRLEWKYPAFSQQVVFEVQQNTNAYPLGPGWKGVWYVPDKWRDFTNVATTSVEFKAVHPAAAFRVRARSLATGLASEWSDK